MQIREVNITVNLSFWERVFHWSYSLPQYLLYNKPALQHWGYRHAPLLLHGHCLSLDLSSESPFQSLDEVSPIMRKYFYWCLLVLHNTGFTRNICMQVCSLPSTQTVLGFTFSSFSYYVPSSLRQLHFYFHGICPYTIYVSIKHLVSTNMISHINLPEMILSSKMQESFLWNW